MSQVVVWTAAALAAGLLALWAAALWPWRGLLGRLWREPVLAVPVVTLESDDWGPRADPEGEARALRALAGVLAAQRDAEGRPAVMTLGIVLAAPDGRVWREAGPDALRRGVWPRVRLADPSQAPILEAVREGTLRGVFVAQLHGMEHCWPPAVRAVAARDARVAEWLRSGPVPDPAALPPVLQTRWADCSTLPSRPIPEDLVEEAVQEEVAAWRALFGTPPRVAVPPTFVWTAAVERAWAARGVRCVVTPGVRHEGRDAAGRPAPGPVVLNGERAAGGARYLVRDVHFEPARGHRPEAALRAVLARARQGRPVLIETHRESYVGEGAAEAREALRALLESVRAALPDVRFLPAETVARTLAQGASSPLVAASLRRRIGAWAARVRALPGARRRLRWSGLGLVLAGVAAALGPRPEAAAAEAGRPRPAGGAA